MGKNPFATGDSAVHEGRQERYEQFKKRLDAILNLETECSFVLDDPAGNSYILSLCAPEPDPQLKITEYERSWEQNEELGLNDMNVDNYDDKPGVKRKLDDIVEGDPDEKKLSMEES